jgi:translation elongation factor EF-1alpha
MTATKTAPKKTTNKKPTKTGPKPLNIKQLVSRCGEKQENFPVYLKTAVNTGWLTDGEFITRLTDAEQADLLQLYNKNKAAKDSKVQKIEPPDQVGVSVQKITVGDKKTKLVSGSGNLVVEVETALYLAMKRRHPKAEIFFSFEDEEKSPVIFSENTAVAMLMPLAK